MKKRQIAQVSVLTAFSLLLFVFSAWMKPFQTQSVNLINHSEQPFCSVPTSASVNLSEVKPRVAGFGPSLAASSFANLPFLFQQKSLASVEQRNIAVGDYPRPLWLLHRSLLI